MMPQSGSGSGGHPRHEEKCPHSKSHTVPGMSRTISEPGRGVKRPLLPLWTITNPIKE
jgi:hypothetical protein